MSARRPDPAPPGRRNLPLNRPDSRPERHTHRAGDSGRAPCFGIGRDRPVFRRCPMVRIELSPEEYELVVQELESDALELKSEIADTDSREFRARLKRKESALRAVLERMRAA